MNDAVLIVYHFISPSFRKCINARTLHIDNMHDFYITVYPSRRKEMEKLLPNINVTTVSGEMMRDASPFVDCVIKIKEDVSTLLVNYLIVAIKNGEIERFKMTDRIRDEIPLRNSNRIWEMSKNEKIPMFSEIIMND